MKFLFDLLPVILFFVAFKVAGIYEATAVAIATTVVQIAWVKFRGKKVSTMQWTSLGIIVIFGGATLLLRDETFIKWKPTVLYGVTGIALIGSLAFGKNLIKAVLAEGGLELPEAVWVKLCVAWGVFFLFQAVLNLWVAYNYPTDTWVNFKLFGGMGLMFLFVVAQALWVSKYLPDEDEAAAGKAKG
ncbi:septation protein A [Usitatibacter palustris]|uniref:Inner membrane-spanning protein YciB n=1 Tax=Usitatibacter palustris TaxID=2732487 RepID=A0A6M4H3E3_9PROT|nr:septation protein A [Usitatibacter palustris]QJR14099.1 Intracellular septation protein [Usitatibacter palustris]